MTTVITHVLAKFFSGAYVNTTNQWLPNMYKCPPVRLRVCWPGFLYVYLLNPHWTWFWFIFLRIKITEQSALKKIKVSPGPHLYEPLLYRSPNDLRSIELRLRFFRAVSQKTLGVMDYSKFRQQRSSKSTKKVPRKDVKQGFTLFV